MTMPLYTVRTWDIELQAFTPQAGLSVPSINVPLWGLKRALRALQREFGWDCYYIRDPDGGHDLNDPLVLVERTDGKQPPCGCRVSHWGDPCQCGFPEKGACVGGEVRVT